MTQPESPQNSTIIEQLRKRTSYLTTTEVMAIICVTRQTLCGWVRSGIISAVRIGKENKFDPRALAAWLEARQV